MPLTLWRDKVPSANHSKLRYVESSRDQNNINNAYFHAQSLIQCILDNYNSDITHLKSYTLELIKHYNLYQLMHELNNAIEQHNIKNAMRYRRQYQNKSWIEKIQTREEPILLRSIR